MVTRQALSYLLFSCQEVDHRQDRDPVIFRSEPACPAPQPPRHLCLPDTESFAP